MENGLLTYPVALLTADEIMLTGENGIPIILVIIYIQIRIGGLCRQVTSLLKQPKKEF